MSESRSLLGKHAAANSLTSSVAAQSVLWGLIAAAKCKIQDEVRNRKDLIRFNSLPPW